MLGKVLEHIMITRILACSRRCKLHSVASQEDNDPNFLNDVLTSTYVICNFWIEVLKTSDEEVEKKKSMRKEKMGGGRRTKKRIHMKG
jgi:hypothetical protein